MRQLTVPDLNSNVRGRANIARKPRLPLSRLQSGLDGSSAWDFLQMYAQFRSVHTTECSTTLRVWKASA